jgi:hypothetical protein
VPRRQQGGTARPVRAFLDRLANRLLADVLLSLVDIQPGHPGAQGHAGALKAAEAGCDTRRSQNRP